MKTIFIVFLIALTALPAFAEGEVSTENCAASLDEHSRTQPAKGSQEKSAESQGGAAEG